MKHSPFLVLLISLWCSLASALPVLAQNGATTAAAAAATQPAGAAGPAVSATVPATPALPPIPGLRAVPAEKAVPSTLGSLDPKADHQLQVDLTGWGAGINTIRLSDYWQTTDRKDPYLIQSPVEGTAMNGGKLRVYPFAARAITVNGQRIDLQTLRWEMIEPGTYSLTLVDGTGNPALTLTRKYTLAPGNLAYELICEQSIANRTNLPLQIIWEQNAQGDMPSEADYQGDRRMIVQGYFNLAYNPSRQFVYSKNAFQTRHEIIDPLTHDASLARIWPPAALAGQQVELAWLSQVNRYFATVVHLPVPQATPMRATALQSKFPVTGLEAIGFRIPGDKDHRGAVLTLTSHVIDVAPGQTADLTLNFYAGPRRSEIFELPAYTALGFGDNLLRYELGCTWCTFQWLARGLLAFLKAIHTALGDWGVAIIVLVLCVRLLLHPITKRSQISMMKMGKQMATLQPEMEKIKTKYKDDQAKLNSEIMKLYREKGVNPAGMLGCAPMFLQMPIWIALYAMLYFAIELRHQPAFYGVFQAISGGAWHFLADLAAPDHFIRFTDQPIHFDIPLISAFDFSALNIIPFIMGFVFYFQMKLSQTPAINDQQKQQQQIMMISTMLFPVFLYAAPSGLNLYIMASTIGGIIDSWIVRRHIKREEEAGTLFATKPAQPRKPGGFMDRLMKAIEARQQDMQRMQQNQQRKKDR